LCISEFIKHSKDGCEVGAELKRVDIRNIESKINKD